MSQTTIVLFSRVGFRKELADQATRRGDVHLVDLPRLLGDAGAVEGLPATGS